MTRRFETRVAVAFASTFLLVMSAQADPHDGLGIVGEVTTYSVPGVEIGGYVSEDGGSGDINVILPIRMPTSHQLFFAGADGKLFDGGFDDLGDSVYNVGAYLGYRERMASGVFGVWLGADHLQTRTGNNFNRFIAGAEYYGERVIVRANGFVPFDSTSDEWSTASSVVNATATGTTIATVTTVFDEKIPSGIDGEIGLRFVAPALRSGMRNGEFRIFAGAYDYFELKQGGGDVPGARGRLELDLYPFEQAPDMRLTLMSSYSHDDHAGGQFDGGVRLSIPFGRPQALASAYSGSIKDGDGSLKDGPAPIAAAAMGSQDLFQPVRRNREPVSLIRQKRQSVVPVSASAAYTLSNVCGSGPIPINWGAGGPPPGGATTIAQGALIGSLFDAAFNPGPNLVLNLAALTNASGQTLAELLATSTESFSTTLSLPIAASFVGVQLDASFGGFCSASATGVNISINSGQCEVQFPGLSVACASDRRLKRDIEFLTTTSEGIKIYSYKYIESFDASGETFVGVMAQDLEQDHSDALVVRPDGYYAVRYDLLGLRMTTLANWQREGLAAVVNPLTQPASIPAASRPDVATSH